MISERKSGSVSMMVIYRAKPGQDDALFQLVKNHWPTISKLGLATPTPARIWRTRNREGHVAFVEMFEWKDAKAPELAHQAPEVMAVWEPMASMLAGIEIAQAELVE